MRDVVIKTGISGWTVSDLVADLDWNVLQFEPHAVSLMFGLNDCVQGTSAIERFRAAYLDVIDRIRQESGAAVLLHTPNGTLPAGGAQRLRFLPAYREAILQVAASADVPCIDHLPLWMAAEASGAMHHWLGHGCHPNEYGHRMLAHTLFRALGIWDEASWTCQLNVPGYLGPSMGQTKTAK